MRTHIREAEKASVRNTSANMGLHFLVCNQVCLSNFSLADSQAMEVLKDLRQFIDKLPTRESQTYT